METYHTYGLLAKLKIPQFEVIDYCQFRSPSQHLSLKQHFLTRAAINEMVSPPKIACSLVPLLQFRLFIFLKWKVPILIYLIRNKDTNAYLIFIHDIRTITDFLIRRQLCSAFNLYFCKEAWSFIAPQKKPE